MKITATAIIQARMGSTRLPGKSMMEISGKPVIQHLIDRATVASRIDRIIVATTTSPEDDVLEQYLVNAGVIVFRGSENNVLNRFADAVRSNVPKDEWQFGAVVRLTADDPVKDPKVIDAVVEAFSDPQKQSDYVCNNQPPWLPEGQDVEVFSIKALLAADESSCDTFEREHVTPYFYNNPNLFRCHSLSGSPNLSYHRWTLDTERDMDFFREVFLHFPNQSMPSMGDILALLEEKPEISTLNSEVIRSSLYRKNIGNQ